MLTVPEAARRSGKDPETIRRWIRSGKLRARKVGTQHVIEEDDLEIALGNPSPDIPKVWALHADGTPMPDVESMVREIRDGH